MDWNETAKSHPVWCPTRRRISGVTIGLVFYLRRWKREPLRNHSVRIQPSLVCHLSSLLISSRLVSSLLFPLSLSPSLSLFLSLYVYLCRSPRSQSNILRLRAFETAKLSPWTHDVKSWLTSLTSLTSQMFSFNRLCTAQVPGSPGIPGERCEESTFLCVLKCSSQWVKTFRLNRAMGIKQEPGTGHLQTKWWKYCRNSCYICSDRNVKCFSLLLNTSQCSLLITTPFQVNEDKKFSLLQQVQQTSWTSSSPSLSLIPPTKTSGKKRIHQKKQNKVEAREPNETVNKCCIQKD